jgi:hypothetical protein
VPAPTTSKDQEVFATPDRFSNLALVYAYIAQSDLIRKLIPPPRPLEDQIQVITPSIPGSSDPLPLIEITTEATGATGAQALNNAVIKALRNYLNRELDANDVKASDRVTLQVLNPPQPGKLTAGRSPTLSLVAFILVMIAALVLVYVLESNRPVMADPAPFDEDLPFDDPDDWASLPRTKSHVG